MILSAELIAETNAAMRDDDAPDLHPCIVAACEDDRHYCDRRLSRR